MERKTYDVDGLVKGGPYSHLVEAGGLLYVSGLVPFDVKKGSMVVDDIEKATKLVLGNVRRALESAGSSLEQVVKTTIFLRDMADFGKMNEVYKTFFPVNPPARSCVAVKEIPGSAPLEIDVVACR
jgi:2-iminobutanoate/2-iminopropanoate deaminase